MHSFRDEAPKKPQVKIKCSSCGCWATRGGDCYHCGKRQGSVPPSCRSAGESLSRSPSIIGTNRMMQSLRESIAEQSKPQQRTKSPTGAKTPKTPNGSIPSTPGSRSGGQSTTQSQSRRLSNSQSASAITHVFRDESAKGPQTKVKCTSCGCWAKRGGTCYFCKRPVANGPPSAQSASDSITRTPSGMAAAHSSQTSKTMPASYSSPKLSIGSVFRDESPKAPQMKVKCSKCGCWAKKGSSCYFCGAGQPSSVPSAQSAHASISRTPSGWSSSVEKEKYSPKNLTSTPRSRSSPNNAANSPRGSKSTPGGLLIAPRSPPNSTGEQRRELGSPREQFRPSDRRNSAIESTYTPRRQSQMSNMLPSDRRNSAIEIEDRRSSAIESTYTPRRQSQMSIMLPSDRRNSPTPRGVSVR